MTEMCKLLGIETESHLEVVLKRVAELTAVWHDTTNAGDLLSPVARVVNAIELGAPQ